MKNMEAEAHSINDMVDAYGRSADRVIEVLKTVSENRRRVFWSGFWCGFLWGQVPGVVALLVFLIARSIAS